LLPHSPLWLATTPIVAWSDADNFLETLDAMALIGETHGIRDFRQ
jgi:hypothetical protein